jgi:effector-binding domain-containing protein
VHDVIVKHVGARPTAVVAATTTLSLWPSVWPELLSEVWACLRAGGIERGCPNVMLYRGTGDDIDAEVGVELRQPCRLTGRIVHSTLPVGEVAVSVHRGPYAELGGAYDAIAEWCARHGLRRTDTRWEIYGPHRDDPAELTTTVYWLLSTS